jgi:hypothetical protein
MKSLDIERKQAMMKITKPGPMNRYTDNAQAPRPVVKPLPMPPQRVKRGMSSNMAPRQDRTLRELDNDRGQQMQLNAMNRR